MASVPLSSPENGSNQANVKVIVRIRPLIQEELSNKYENVTEAISDRMLVFDPKVQQIEGFLHTQRRNITGRRFKDLKYAFDHVLRSSARNRDVFEKSTQSIVKTVLKGYNCSVFAYGATGSGKTHTMLGNENEPGVIYHTMLDLYKEIDALKEEKIFNVAVSYLEIYNETVRDLLNPKKNLPIREDKMAGVMIAGLSLHKPECAEDLLHMLHHGNKNRSQHPTDANAESSRSHAVFQVFVKQRSRSASANSQVQMAKMCLVDLAGSERAIHTRNVGARFREGANINRSLLALGNVINALAAKSKGHIPYRDSKLTRLLKDSLGGNCQTVMIATISPSSRSYEDTYNTLRYADRAKHIKADLTRNIVSIDQHIVNYKIYVADLERENRDLREKTRLLQESTGLVTGPSLSTVNVIKQFEDKMLELFKTRKDIMRSHMTSEVVKRELKWKLSRKERTIKRVEMLTGLKEVVSKHQRKADRMQCRYLKEEVSSQKSTQQLKQHDQSIYNLGTELTDLTNIEKGSREHLSASMRYYVTDSYLCDLDLHLCFVKKMARAQERQSVVNERVILSLIQLVKKQQSIMKTHNMSSPEVEQAYKDCCYLVEERGVTWVQQHSNKTKKQPDETGASTSVGDGDNGISNLLEEEDKEDLRISDIIDIQLPKIALNSLKLGNIGSPAKKRKQQTSTAALQDEMVMAIPPSSDVQQPSQRLPPKVARQPQPQPKGPKKHQQLFQKTGGENTAKHLGFSSSLDSSLQQKVLVDGGPNPIVSISSKTKDVACAQISSGLNDKETKKTMSDYKPSNGNASLQTEKILTPREEEKNNCLPVEGGGGYKTCATTPSNDTKDKDKSGQNFGKTSSSVSVKKLVERYSGSSNNKEATPTFTNSSNVKSSPTFGRNGSDSPKCSIYAAANSSGVNTTQLLSNEKQLKPGTNDTTGTGSGGNNSDSPGAEKSSNENDVTPVSLNETFEVDKPAIPNTPCIDGPVPKSRRLGVSKNNSHISTPLSNSSKKQNGNNTQSQQFQLSSTSSLHKNQSDSSHQQRYLNKQLSQSTVPSSDRHFNRRLSFTIAPSSTSKHINDTKICPPEMLNSYSLSKKLSPVIHSPATDNHMGDTDNNEADSPMLFNANNKPSLLSKSNLSRELDKLQKFSKLRSSQSSTRFTTNAMSTPQCMSPTTTSSPVAGVVKSSPCLNKWDLMRERGIAKGSKLWRSLSAQQLGLSNNNNSSLFVEESSKEYSSNGGMLDLISELDPLRTSSPKMEVEVCISPKPTQHTTQSHSDDNNNDDDNDDGNNYDKEDDNGKDQGSTDEMTKKTIGTPELKVNPFMQTVIESLKKHGIPSLTERLSLIRSTTTKLVENKPAPVSPYRTHRERSPLRVLDVNSNKYQSKRLGANPTDVSKSSSTLQENPQQAYKKTEPLVASSFPSSWLNNEFAAPMMSKTSTSTTSIAMKCRMDRTKDRRRHQREVSSKPYSRETILANRGQRLAAALKKINTNTTKDVPDQESPFDPLNGVVSQYSSNNNSSNNTNTTNSTTTTTTAAKPSYMLSTFAASQRATGLLSRDKGNANNTNTKNKFSSWSVLSQQAITSTQPPQRRQLSGAQRNKSYLPWLQS